MGSRAPPERQGWNSSSTATIFKSTDPRHVSRCMRCGRNSEISRRGRAADSAGSPAAAGKIASWQRPCRRLG
eukprot:3462145-Pyramimonas_sp.AAC.1